MSRKNNYRILPDQGLIIECFYGETGINDIIALKEIVKKDKDFDFKYNIIDDYRDTNIHVSHEEIYQFKEWMQHNFSSSRKSSVLTETPNQVSAIMLFDRMQNNELPMNIKLFSTSEAALRWVDVDDNSIADIVELIQHMKEEA